MASATALKPTGVLRITSSLSFSVHHIAPLLHAYTQRYPGVTVHVEAANRYVDLIDSNIDVAIRTRELEPDSNVTIRRLGETRRILAAIQPTYIIYGDIVAGRLVPTLDDWDLPRLTINLAYPSRKHISAKVRTFIDFVAEHFSKMDYERKWTGRMGTR